MFLSVYSNYGPTDINVRPFLMAMNVRYKLRWDLVSGLRKTYYPHFALEEGGFRLNFFVTDKALYSGKDGELVQVENILPNQYCSHCKTVFDLSFYHYKGGAYVYLCREYEANTPLTILCSLDYALLERGVYKLPPNSDRRLLVKNAFCRDYFGKTDQAKNVTFDRFTLAFTREEIVPSFKSRYMYLKMLINSRNPHRSCGSRVSFPLRHRTLLSRTTNFAIGASGTPSTWRNLG